MAAMDPATHKRFLDYRERAVYFRKRGAKDLTQEEFTAADAEHRALAAKGDARDDEEDARFAELAKVLYRD
jgi:hypothetical protein